MIPTVFKKNQMWFDPDAGHWMITTDISLPKHALQSAAKWCKKLQLERLRSLPAGDKRDLINRSIAELDRLNIRQNIVNAQTKTGRGDLSIFEARL